jgi:ribonuclease BN (tRNA processing enzyme)
MRVRVIGAGSPTAGFSLSTFVIDDVLALDAGALGWFDTPERQAEIRDIFLTHAHLDHIAGLASFIENVYGLAPDPPRIHAPEPVLRVLQDHVLNDKVLPDFVRLSEPPTAPFLQLCPIVAERPYSLGRFHVAAFEVDHTVPTVGYAVNDNEDTVVLVTDTAPVPAVMSMLAQVPQLRAVFLEASFPSDLAQLAEVTKHHTASQFLAAARQFPPAVRVFAVHVKPRHVEAITAEVRAAGLPNVGVAVPGQVVEV